MIPAPFEYVRATSVDHASGLLAADEDAKALAGGMSLIPLLRLRLIVRSIYLHGNMGSLPQKARAAKMRDTAQQHTKIAVLQTKTQAEERGMHER